MGFSTSSSMTTSFLSFLNRSSIISLAMSDTLRICLLATNANWYSVIVDGSTNFSLSGNDFVKTRCEASKFIVSNPFSMNFYGNETNVGFLEANISSNEAPFPCWEYLTLTLFIWVPFLRKCLVLLVVFFVCLVEMGGTLETRISMIENEMWVPEGHVTGMLQEHTNATQSFHNQASTFHGSSATRKDLCLGGFLK